MTLPINPVIIPIPVAVEQVIRDVGRAYACPECAVENTSSPSGIRWVHCPIYRDNYICEGSCIDIASISRDTNIEVNAFANLLDEIARTTRLHPQHVRLICLKHQRKILEEMLASSEITSEWKQVRTRQLKSIDAIMSRLEDKGM